MIFNHMEINPVIRVCGVSQGAKQVCGIVGSPKSARNNSRENG